MTPITLGQALRRRLLSTWRRRPVAAKRTTSRRGRPRIFRPRAYVKADADEAERWAEAVAGTSKTRARIIAEFEDAARGSGVTLREYLPAWVGQQIRLVRKGRLKYSTVDTYFGYVWAARKYDVRSQLAWRLKRAVELSHAEECTTHAPDHELDELHRVIAKLHGKKQLAIWLMLATGLRLKDMCRLRRGQVCIDVNQKHFHTKDKGIYRIRVRRTKALLQRGHRKTLDTPMCWAGTPPRSVLRALPTATTDKVGEVSWLLGVAINTEQWAQAYDRFYSDVQRSLKAEGMTTYTFRRWYMRRVKDAGCAELSLHLNKHTREAFYEALN